MSGYDDAEIECLKKIKEKLVHLKKKGDFTMDELVALGDEIGQITKGRPYPFDKQANIGEALVNEILNFYFELARSHLTELSEELSGVHDQLVEIKDKLVELQNEPVITASQYGPYQVQLNKIEAKYVKDGKFMDGNGNIPTGQAMLFSLLNKNHNIIHRLQVESETKRVDDELHPIQTALLDILKGLEELKREVALPTADQILHYQVKLREIETNFITDGKFRGKDEFSVVNPPRKGQAVLFGLLAKCHEIASRMLEETEEIDPTLSEIHNRLVENLEKLLRLSKQSTRPKSEELVPIQKNLTHIEENFIKDGRFITSGMPSEIPKGQARLSELLWRCREVAIHLSELSE